MSGLGESRNFVKFSPLYEREGLKTLDLRILPARRAGAEVGKEAAVAERKDGRSFLVHHPRLCGEAGSTRNKTRQGTFGFSLSLPSHMLSPSRFSQLYLHNISQIQPPWTTPQLTFQGPSYEYLPWIISMGSVESQSQPLKSLEPILKLPRTLQGGCQIQPGLKIKNVLVYIQRREKGKARLLRQHGWTLRTLG